MASHGLCGDQHIVNTGISANVLHLLHPGIWHLILVTGECVHWPSLTTPALSHRKCRTQLCRQMPNLANFALQNVK